MENRKIRLSGGIKWLMLPIAVNLIRNIHVSSKMLIKKNRQLENQLRNLQKEYCQISSHIEEAKRTRHDLRHCLNTISVLNLSDKKTELNEYLKSCDLVCREIENISLCEYPLFDSIFKYYVGNAEKENISVNTEFHSITRNPDFDIVDMTCLLGNLMENATEACCLLPPYLPRFINIWVKLTENVLLIKVENSCPAGTKDHPSFSDGSVFRSTKKSALHGQGLKSIRHTVKKYNGSAEFKKTKGVFTARVVLNVF